MSNLYDRYYKGACTSCHFEWDKEEDTKSQGRVMDSWIHTPALLLSDSEDDISVPEAFAEEQETTRPLHQEDPAKTMEDVRHVHFKAAQIREHSVTIGDHPACCDCLPLALDWEHGEEQTYDIDDYESMRASSGRSERGRLERLDYWERRSILEKGGTRTHLEIGVDDQLPPIAPPTYEIEEPLDAPIQCNPFAVFESSSWGSMFGDGACMNYPTMTVHIIED